MTWYRSFGPKNDIIISTRVRLARNLSGYPFSSKLKKEEGEKIIDLVWEALAPIAKNFTLYRIHKLAPVKQQALIEKHLISPDLTAGNFPRAVMINKEESVAIMVNEEDHIRIQCLTPGFAPDEAWETASRIDDLLGETLDFAFHEKYGYLTSCPTNTGTGLRVSAMVHLPAISVFGRISGLLSQAAKSGMTVRGLYGEGSDAQGNFYQISNQVTLGASEEELIERFNKVVSSVCEVENTLRNQLKKDVPAKLIDRIMRSYGAMQYAYMVSGKEMLNILSDVRLGIYLGILKPIPFEKLTSLMVITMPANITGSASSMSAESRDIKRAKIIKETVM
ncbi:MAG: protein arginine kinase [Clostridia bacterium]|nr:protein arginine kinase [Oscillospiraceae bacterium]MBQ7032125.1 protein arginine kinase [Clostridia bacterium]